MTEEERAAIKREEFDEVNKPSTIALREQRKKMKLMELNSVQEMLLKKLIAFEAIENSKNEEPELKYNMYKLFFGVKVEDKQQEKETDSQKDGETIDHDKDERMKKLALKLEQ